MEACVEMLAGVATVMGFLLTDVVFSMPRLGSLTCPRPASLLELVHTS